MTMKTTTGRRAGEGGNASLVSILLEILGSQEVTEKIISRLADEGLVCVPRDATDQMLSDAWGEIHDEDGRAVWEAMVESATTTQAEESPGP